MNSAETSCQNMHMPALARSNIHLDILMGRDESVDVNDIFGGTVPRNHSKHLCHTKLAVQATMLRLLWIFTHRWRRSSVCNATVYHTITTVPHNYFLLPHQLSRVISNLPTTDGAVIVKTLGHAILLMPQIIIRQRLVSVSSSRCLVTTCPYSL